MATRPRSLVVAGCGSLGSLFVQELSRVRRLQELRLILVDPDVLSEANLPRHCLPRSFVGRNKADALSEQFQSRPGWTVESHPRRATTETVPFGALNVIAIDNEEDRRRLGFDLRLRPVWLANMAVTATGDLFGEIVLAGPPFSGCYLCWARHWPASFAETEAEKYLVSSPTGARRADAVDILPTAVVLAQLAADFLNTGRPGPVASYLRVERERVMRTLFQADPNCLCSQGGPGGRRDVTAGRWS